MPKVSVIMNCHNGAQYLAEAIDSVYAQTFQDFEIIFYDNASTDKSVEIAAGYDDRLKITKNTGALQTLGHARSAATKLARGQWIGFLDTDDTWFPSKLEAQLVALADTDYAMCYAGVEEVNENGAHIRYVTPNARSGKILRSLLHQFDIHMVTALLKRESLESLGLNFSRTMEASEEYNLFMQIAAAENILVLKSVLGQYRYHERNLTNKKMHRWSSERNETLDHLVAKNPELLQTHYADLAEAYARGNYYRAVSLMNDGKHRAAVREIDIAADKAGLKYMPLRLVIRFPWLWKFLHRPGYLGLLRSLIRPFHGRL